MGSIPGNLHPFPKIVGITLLLISIWNYPAHKNQPQHTSRPPDCALCDGSYSLQTHPLQWPLLSLWSVLLPESEKIHILPIPLSITKFFLWWGIKNLSSIMSWNQYRGFGLEGNGHDFTFTFHFHTLEKEMATHSSTLAWRIPGSGEPGGLPAMGSHRVGHNWSDLAAAAASPDHVGLCLTLDFGWVGVPACGFKSQSEVNTNSFKYVP